MVKSTLGGEDLGLQILANHFFVAVAGYGKNRFVSCLLPLDITSHLRFGESHFGIEFGKPTGPEGQSQSGNLL